MRNIQVPKGAVKRLTQIALLQIEDELPVEPSRYIVDAVATRESEVGGNMDSMVVAALKDDVRVVIEILSEVGFDPAEITCAPSFFQFAANINDFHGEGNSVAFLEIGHRVSELVIIEGGVPVLYRAIVWGGVNITEKISTFLSIPYEHAQEIKHQYGCVKTFKPLSIGSMEEKVLGICREACGPLITDVRQSLIGYAAKKGRFPGKLFIFGGAVKLGGMSEYLGEMVGLETQIARKEEGIQPEFIRARAVLEKIANPLSRASLNFRKGEFLYKGKVEVAKRKWMRFVAFVSVIIIGWFLYSMAKIWALNETEKKQGKELLELTTDISGEGTDSFEKGRMLLIKTSEARNPVPKQDVYDILEKMSDIIPDDIVHDVEELDIRPDRWRIRGIVDSIADRDRILEALTQYKECVKDVKKGTTTLSPKDNRQKYNFDMVTTCP